MFSFSLLVFVLGSGALSLRHDTELSPGDRGVQAGREPLGGIRSHLIFGSCMPEGEMWMGGDTCAHAGVPGLTGRRAQLGRALSAQ